MTAMLTRSTFKRPVYAPPRQPTRPVPALFRAPEPVSARVVAVQKTEPQRNRALLDMADGRPCLLRIPGVCSGDAATTVACHSNLGIHGKAKGRKADDQYSVWGCACCHRWLDQGPATQEQKTEAFMRAHQHQVLAWREIAQEIKPGTWREREAAKWALVRLWGDSAA